MTCITAMVKGDHVWMAGDLMGSNGFTKKIYPDSKVFVNGEFIIGYTSSFRMGQLLQYNWEQPPRLEGMTTENIFSSMLLNLCVIALMLSVTVLKMDSNTLGAIS